MVTHESTFAAEPISEAAEEACCLKQIFGAQVMVSVVLTEAVRVEKFLMLEQNDLE